MPGSFIQRWYQNTDGSTRGGLVDASEAARLSVKKQSMSLDHKSAREQTALLPAQAQSTLQESEISSAEYRSRRGGQRCSRISNYLVRPLVFALGSLFYMLAKTDDQGTQDSAVIEAAVAAGVTFAAASVATCMANRGAISDASGKDIIVRSLPRLATFTIPETMLRDMSATLFGGVMNAATQVAMLSLLFNGAGMDEERIDVVGTFVNTVAFTALSFQFFDAALFRLQQSTCCIKGDASRRVDPETYSTSSYNGVRHLFAALASGSFGFLITRASVANTQSPAEMMAAHAALIGLNAYSAARQFAQIAGSTRAADISLDNTPVGNKILPVMLLMRLTTAMMYGCLQASSAQVYNAVVPYDSALIPRNVSLFNTTTGNATVVTEMVAPPYNFLGAAIEGHQPGINATLADFVSSTLVPYVATFPTKLAVEGTDAAQIMVQYFMWAAIFGFEITAQNMGHTQENEPRLSNPWPADSAGRSRSKLGVSCRVTYNATIVAMLRLFNLHKNPLAIGVGWAVSHWRVPTQTALEKGTLRSHNMGLQTADRELVGSTDTALIAIKQDLMSTIERQIDLQSMQLKLIEKEAREFLALISNANESVGNKLDQNEDFQQQYNQLKSLIMARRPSSTEETKGWLQESIPPFTNPQALVMSNIKQVQDLIKLSAEDIQSKFLNIQELHISKTLALVQKINRHKATDRKEDIFSNPSQDTSDFSSRAAEIYDKAKLVLGCMQQIGRTLEPAATADSKQSDVVLTINAPLDHEKKDAKDDQVELSIRPLSSTEVHIRPDRGQVELSVPQKLKLDQWAPIQLQSIEISAQVSQSPQQQYSVLIRSDHKIDALKQQLHTHPNFQRFSPQKTSSHKVTYQYGPIPLKDFQKFLGEQGINYELELPSTS